MILSSYCLRKSYVEGIYRKEHSYQKGDLIYYSIGPFIPYEGVDDFLNKNRECCRILLIHKRLENSGPPEIDKYRGNVYGFLDINYSYFYRDKNNNVKKIKDTVYYPISNCGELNKMSIMQDHFNFKEDY